MCTMRLYKSENHAKCVFNRFVMLERDSAHGKHYDERATSPSVLALRCSIYLSMEHLGTEAVQTRKSFLHNMENYLFSPFP